MMKPSVGRRHTTGASSGEAGFAARRRRVTRDQRGVAAVEFSLVALAMLTFMFGMMEVARAYWDYQIIEEVAFEGARCMGVLAGGCSSGGAYSSTAASNYIVALAQKRGLTLTGSDLTLTRPTSCASTAGFSQVAISYAFVTSFPVLIPGLTNLTLSTSACYYNTQ